MTRETLETLRKIYLEHGEITFRDPEQLSKLVQETLHNEDREIILRAIERDIATLVIDMVKSIIDIESITLIRDKLAITWRVDLAETVVRAFVQAKFDLFDPIESIPKNESSPPQVSNYDKNIFKIQNNVLLKFTGPQSHVVIPDGVTAIADKAFYKCKHVKSITIPPGVTSIGDSAFDGCNFLNSVTISDEVVSIGNMAFNKCKSLTTISLPKNIKHIGRSAFAESGLIFIDIPKTVTHLDHLTFFKCKNLTSATISEGVRVIGHNVFSKCNNLTQISIPSTLENIATRNVTSKAEDIRSGHIWKLLTKTKW